MSNTQVVTWKDKMAALAKTQAVNETASGQFFSTKAGVLAYGGTAFPNSEFEGIIVASCVERHYYSKPYSAGDVQSPDCFAFGKTISIESPVTPPLTAHKDASKIVKKDGCAGCPMDAWGTDIQGGKGKGCKEVRRLGLIPLDALKGGPETIMAAPVGYLRVPIMSVPNFSAYVKTLAAKGESVIGVVTRVKLVPDSRSMFSVTFEKVGSVENEITGAALWDKAEAVHAIIDFPYRSEGGNEQTTAPQGGKKQKF